MSSTHIVCGSALCSSHKRWSHLILPKKSSSLSLILWHNNINNDDGEPCRPCYFSIQTSSTFPFPPECFWLLSLMTMASTCWSLLTASSSSPSKQMMSNKSLSVAVASTAAHQTASAMVTTNTTKMETTNNNKGNYLEQACFCHSSDSNCHGDNQHYQNGNN